MKSRKGFVSNSSSSSFIIATKGDLTIEKLMKWAKISDDSPFKFAVTGFLSCLISHVERKHDAIGSYVEDTVGNGDDVDQKIVEYLKNGFTVHEGSLNTDSGEAEEQIIAGLDIDYETDDLIVKHNSSDKR